MDVNWGGLAYSMHRYYLDVFCERELGALPPASRVLDIGGHRLRKRGQFDIDRLGHHVTYLNLLPDKRPHVQGDAARLPIRSQAYDAAVLAELLEHVPDPPLVLAEAARILRPGGTLFITVPFLVAIHGDPGDYGRYTPQYWQERLAQAGFQIRLLEWHGRYWSVMADSLRVFAAYGLPGMALGSRIARRLIASLVPLARRLAVRWDARPAVLENPSLAAFTTGYGIVAVRGPEPGPLPHPSPPDQAAGSGSPA